MTPDQQQEVLDKARQQVKQMREEAEAELKRELEQRSERGIGNGGDDVTKEDLKLLDADYTR